MKDTISATEMCNSEDERDKHLKILLLYTELQNTELSFTDEVNFTMDRHHFK